MGDVLSACREIRIRRVGKPVATDLKNISGHIGITENEFLKPKVTDIVNSFPQYMREDKPVEKSLNEVRLRGIGKKTKEQLQNIANYIGVDLGDLLKVKLAEVSYTFPDHIRNTTHEK